MTDKKIKVTVKFFASLREFGPKKEKITLPKNSTVKDILDKYNIPEENRNVIVLINRKPHKKIDDELSNNDYVVIFPPIGGG
ncbi:MAG: MoaD/ThiS family protein [Asgard group archaeon]|nr:MoaD/ThiS family protein [Asgard group archaeon]